MSPKTTNNQIPTRSKTLKGVVVSDKMKDTVVVLVNRYVKHPKYHKFVNFSKKYKAHDVGNTKKIGETVEIRETKPISKDKHFVVIENVNRKVQNDSLK